MSYNLVITDDEELIASGLREIIPWASLGFEVVAVFTDGRDLIEYIKDNEVHVILTDVKMNAVSGIDVARYVHENRLSIRVVFLSAHSDFIYARSAVDYNVSKYLLKPTKLPEMVHVFEELRSELDEQERSTREYMELREKDDRVDSLLKRQFFSDIYYGALRTREEILHHLRMLDLDIEPDRGICGVFSISMVDAGEAGQLREIQNFVNATRLAFVNSRSHAMNFYPLYQSSQRIVYIAVQLAESMEGWNISRQESSIRFHFDELITQIRAVFNITMAIEMHAMYETLFEFAEHCWEIQFGPVHKGDADGLSGLESLIARLISYARSNEQAMAKNMAEMLFEQIGDQPYMLQGITAVILRALHGGGHRKKGDDARGLEPVDIICHEQAAEMVAHTIENAGQQLATADSGDDSIEAALEYIHFHFAEDIFLDSVAEYVSLSPSYLSRLFKRRTGMNFTQYIMNHRLEEAKKMLKETDDRIYEISKSIGYLNIHYFFRIFKQHCGMTPHEYRRVAADQGTHEA